MVATKFSLILIIIHIVASSCLKNVLLIIADDLRALDNDAVTPNIDKFSKSSLNFNYAYAQVSNWTFLFDLILLSQS